MEQQSQINALPPLFTSEQLDRELFAMFDIHMQGFIESRDLETIGRAMGWKTDQSKLVSIIKSPLVQELIATIDPNQNGRLVYDEFLLVLRYIEERQISNHPQNSNQNNSRLSNNANAQQ